MKRRKFVVTAFYDTETCNIDYTENGKTYHRAYPILFIDNDLRGVSLTTYRPDIDDNISFYRKEHEMLEKIDDYIEYGKAIKQVPIICAYNLMFDMQPLMYELNKKYEMRASAQSTTHVYTLDIIENDEIILRFWDMFFLEMRGVEAMGVTCGFEKAVGSWDYDLIRTPETPLTDDELYYASRDVQVLPCYLQWLLRANEWLRPNDFGFRVLTKTSIVRQMARRKIGNMRLGKGEKKISIDKDFSELCYRELPSNFNTYCLRKSCFRGGLTFTSARYANVIQHDVISMDAVSMHHTYINGRLVPVNFNAANHVLLKDICNAILNTSLDYILEHYDRPFMNAIHAKIKFNNIRLKKNSAFDYYGIGILAAAKFKKNLEAFSDYGLNEVSTMQENYIKSLGWTDIYTNATFAFSKLYKADSIIVHVSEIELWCMAQVYEWDSYSVLYGEYSTKFINPPYFVSLQSNILFEQKSAAKFVYEHYTEGENYTLNTALIPDGIAATLKDGTCDKQFFYEWYTNTVKGMYNGIFGSQAMDIYKPNYTVDGGSIVSDTSTKTTEENWDLKQPDTCRVLYTYGMRIVAGSRMHLVIVIKMLFEKFGKKLRILGGDTDSIKASLNGISETKINECLMPINSACDEAIKKAQRYIRKDFPKLASSFKDVGHFEIENSNAHYTHHLELWNKARLSYDGKTHVTMAGISRPSKKYHLGTFIDDLIEHYPIEDVYLNCVKYNNVIDYEISNSLEVYIPKPEDVFEREVTDYLGHTTKVIAHESKALYKIARMIGDSTMFTNLTTVAYLKSEYGREVNETSYQLVIERGVPIVKAPDSNGNMQVLMRGKNR